MSRAKLTPAVKAKLAFMRFGLGPKPGGAARIGMEADSALNACLREIASPDPAQIPESDVKVFSTEANAQVSLNYDQVCWFGMNVRKMDEDNYIRPLPQDIAAAERAARYAKHMSPDVGFLERLVLFWSNHFSIFEAKSHLVRATVGHLERAVIRPNVLGRFSDMLKGVMAHPAMIAYLDNHLSFGPGSPEGKRLKRTYNENLAREILELHTLGVGAKYTQEDVINFAKVLTGWTIHGASHAKAGQFHFNPAWHEPGAFTIMKQSFAQDGQAQGLAVLNMLANHPATAQHIAFKLLLHFVTDKPQPKLVKSLAGVFLRTRGDLKAVATAMLRMAQSWSEPMTRLRQPYPWMVSQMRAMGLDGAQAAQQEGRLARFLSATNHQPWRRITPDGYPDENYVWQNPNAIRLRKDVAGAFVSGAVAGGKWTGPKPAALAADLLPGALSAESAAEIAWWKNDLQALNILFVTPEYLRR